MNQLLTVKQHSRLGKEVLQDCNLTNLTTQQVQQLKQSLWEHGVIVVKKQKLTATQLKDFAIKTFGDSKAGSRPKTLDPEINPDLQSSGVFILGNPKGLSQQILGKFAWQWHHDKDHLPKTEGLDMNSLYVVMIYGVQIPPEGTNGEPHTTNFLDMVEAYHNLDSQHRQQLEQLSMVLSQAGTEGESLQSRVAAIYAVEVDTTGELLQVNSAFEGDTELVAKVQVMAQYPADEQIAIGDSLTDLNMALKAPIVFARDRLLDYLNEYHKPYFPWNDFFDVRQQLSQMWQG